MMNLRHLNTFFFLGVLITVTWSAYLLFIPFIGPIFTAVVLAILFYPLYERLCALTNGRKALAASSVLLVIALTIILPIVSVSMLLVGEVTDIVQNVAASSEPARIIEQKVDKIASIVPGFSSYLAISQDTFTNIAQHTGSFFVKVAQKTYANVIGSVLGVFVLFFTLFFLFVDGKKFAQKLMFLSPLSDRHERLLFETFSAMSRATIKGTIIIGFIQGSLGALAFYIAGVPSVFVWFVVMVFLAIIPFLGVGIIGFPAALYYLITGNTVAGLILLGSFIFISFIDNYLRPLIVGRDAQMHTLLVFFATLGGIMTFGLIGFIVGPIIMALFVTLWHIYGLEFEQQLKKHNNMSGK